jgi:hypothetical protein
MSAKSSEPIIGRGSVSTFSRPTMSPRDLRQRLGGLLVVDEHVEDRPDLDRDLDPEGQGEAGREGPRALVDGRGDLGREGADRPRQVRLFGNDVVGRAGMDLRDRHHGRLQRMRGCG